VTGEVRIRTAAPDDAAGLATLKVRAWRAAYTGLLPDRVLVGLRADEEAAAWRAYIAAPPPADRLWLAEAPGPAVAGFARTGPCADDDVDAGTGEVHGLYVEPELIASGLGRALFAHAVADLAARGFTRVVVWHFAGNDRAARFYDRAGFAPDGARRASTFGVDEVRRSRAVAGVGG
jgi:GNAT superfamily N-acetyltransferase